MSYLPLPEKEDLTGKVRQLFEEAEQRWGYIPNIVRAYSLAPEILEAEDKWSEGVMKKGFLSRKLKEAIGTTVSATNDCNYCATSHAHAYTLAGGDDAEARSILSLERSGIDERENIALDFAQKATLDAKSIQKEDIELLRKHYSPGEIVEICTVIQAFMGYNWFVTILGLELEEANPLLQS